MVFTRNPEVFVIDSLLDYLLCVLIALLYKIYFISYKDFYNWSLDFGLPGVIANQLRITWCHMSFEGVYNRFKICTIVPLYLYCSMCFDLHHCAHLCTCINMYLLPAFVHTKYWLIWIFSHSISPICNLSPNL